MQLHNRNLIFNCFRTNKSSLCTNTLWTQLLKKSSFFPTKKLIRFLLYWSHPIVKRLRILNKSFLLEKLFSWKTVICYLSVIFHFHAMLTCVFWSWTLYHCFSFFEVIVYGFSFTECVYHLSFMSIMNRFWCFRLC